ncbi:hypothetical protein NIA69_17690 [Gemmiger formicilis]|nr:hypothetical protein [Gemmiger formicilis]
MKIMFYALRPFDEQQYCEPYKARYGIDYTGTPDVPRPDNLHLAEGCDAVSTNPCEIRPEYLQAWAEMGVKYLPCRSIGYDHIPLDTAKSWVCASATAITRRTAWPTIRSCSC